MARSGITYTEVADVCDQLQAQGIRPTVDRIREHLGTGSRTTINTHKTTWEARQTSLTENPDRISESLTRLISQLSEQLHEECQAVYDQYRKQDATRIAEREKQLTEATHRLEAIQKRFEQTCSEKEALVIRLDQEKTAREQLALELHRAQTQLEEREHLRQADQQQILALSERNQQLQRAFDHYQESVREQRERNENQWDQERGQLQADIRNLRDQLASRIQQIADLNRDNGVLVSEKGELGRQCRLQQEAAHDLKGRMTTLENQLLERQTRLDRQSEKLTELVATNTRQELILERLRQQNKIMVQAQARKQQKEQG
jgi:chromosome segregation ATPase